MGGESAEQSTHETGQSAEQAMVDAIGDPSEWGDAAHGYADREAVRRFLDSEDWNLKASRSKLLRALDWRTKERPWELSCSVCATNPRAHSLRCVGLDQQSRPVIYTNFVEAEESEHSSGNVEHLTRISEEAERIMLRHGQSRYGKWVWMVDFQGFHWGDANPQSALSAANLLDKFPERLSQAFLVDPPSIFWSLWSVCKPILKERTKQKVVFLKLSELDSKGETLGREITDWVKAEGNENRWLSNTEDGQKQPPKRYWRAPTNGHTHDPRGVQSFVQSDDFFLPTQWYGEAYDPDVILDECLQKQRRRREAK